MEKAQLGMSARKIRRGGSISESDSDSTREAEVKPVRKIAKVKRKRNTEPVANSIGFGGVHGDFAVKKIKLEPNSISEAFTAKDEKKKRESFFGSNEDMEAEIKTLKKKLEIVEELLKEKNLENERLKRLAKLDEGDHSWRKVNVISALSSEAWRMIPNQVENMEDLHLCFQAFQELERVTVEKKVQTLLPDVLNIFLEHDIDIDHYKGANWLRHWLLLGNLRLVCKSWKSSVDGLLELQPFHVNSSPFYTWGGEPEKCCPISPEITNYSNREVERFKTYVKYFVSLQTNDLSYNPLPARNLVVNARLFDEDEDVHEITEKLSDALRRYLRAFGHHVWHFTVEIEGAYRRRSEVQMTYPLYKFVCEWLRLIPNLKSLAIISDLDDIDKEVITQIDQLSFPHLNHLEIFKIDDLNIFVSNLLKNNGHIQKLFIEDTATWSSEKLDSLSGIMTSSFPNLLECSLFGEIDYIVNKQTLGIWELQRLTLIFGDRNNQNPKINKLISAVTRTNLLEHLTLDFVHLHSNLKGQMLDLPSLKSLFIMLGKYEVIDWYNLLIKATSLETITVDIYYVDGDECEELLEIGQVSQEFQTNMKMLQEAAFWHFLPQLKSVSFTIYHHESIKYRKQVYSLERHQQMPRLRLSVEFKGYH